MKVKALSLVACLLFAIGTSAFCANITITGTQIVDGAYDYTYYATPVAPGATYTWSVSEGTIVAQNTNPAAGPIYVTIHWYTPGLYQDYIGINDNQGNSGVYEVYVGVNPIVASQIDARLEVTGTLEEKRRKLA